MRRILTAAVMAVALTVAAGCGSKPSPAPHPAVPTKAPFVCQPQAAPAAGECQRQELAYRGIKPSATAPSFSLGRAQGIDISRYQPHPAFRTLYSEGIRFVIIQTNAGGCACNPFFDEQVRDAHAAGLKVGVYVFVEASSASEQTDLLGRIAAPVRSLINAGAYVDTEVPGAYERGCEIVARLFSVWHFYTAGIYASNGTWPGYECQGFDWPAKWGGLVSPLPGYPFSRTLLRQWCGTCYLNGVGETDRDEDLGLLARSTPSKPAPTHAEVLTREHHELDAHYRLRAELHGDIERHQCRLDKHGHGHETPHTHRQWALCRAWISHGQQEVTLILRFHGKGVY